MTGWGGNSGGGPPSWRNDCEATTSPADLSHTVLAPRGGVTYYPGEQIKISWQSGVRSDVLRIDGPPWAGGFHPVSWQWSAFLQSEDRETSVTILDNQNFTFGYDVAWKVLDDCANTVINQTWTVPSNIDVTETVFNVVVVNMTNPHERSSTTGPAFTIEEMTSSAGTEAHSSTESEPSLAAATATSNSPPEGNAASTTSLPTPSLSPAPEEESITAQDGGDSGGQGLAVGARAGIGASVGVSGVFFLLALLLFWRRRRRSPAEDSANPNYDEEKADAELDGDSRRPAVEAEAPVPRELPATSNGGEEDAKTPCSALSVDFDPHAPRYPSGPVEMPADEVAVAEMPDNSRPYR